MRCRPILLALALPLAALAQDALDAAAAWRAPAHFMATVRSRCAGAEPGRYGACLVRQMAAAGASPQAVGFSEQLLGDTGQTGYAREVRLAGPLRTVAVEYPLRANENSGWLLVDASGQRIDVDDIDGLPWEGMTHDATYRALLAAHPRLALFPAERGAAPAAEPLPGGGWRVAVRYALVDGCHACARLGSASVGYDFDGRGQYAGPTLLAVEAVR